MMKNFIFSNNLSLITEEDNRLKKLLNQFLELENLEFNKERFLQKIETNISKIKIEIKGADYLLLEEFNYQLKYYQKLKEISDKDFEEIKKYYFKLKDEKEKLNKFNYECLSCGSIFSRKIEKCSCGSEKIKTLKRGKLNKEIFLEVKQTLSKYIDTSQENIEILSLWLIGTYFHNQFETYPILQLNAQKRSGKTRTLKLLSSLCNGSDGSVSTSATETHLFRHEGGALFFDEMESISSKERSAFRETLNAVYKRGNKIIRYKESKADGEKKYVQEAFYPYYPLGLANISGIGDVLADRSVQIILRRSSKQLTKLVENFSTNKDIIALKNKLETINAEIPKNFFDNWNDFIEKKLKEGELKDFFEKIDKTKIYGRALEIFFPLFFISYLCEDIDNFLITAKDYVEHKEEEEAIDDYDERLKNFIIERFSEIKDFIPVSPMCKNFRESLENPEEWINVKWFGRALKRLDLVKNKRVVNGKAQVLLKINPTNPTNTTNTTNTTNPTKEVELVGFVGSVGLGGYGNNPTKILPKEDFK